MLTSVDNRRYTPELMPLSTGGTVEKLGDFYSVEAAASATGIKYKTLLQRIARGRVKAEEFGRMKVIPVEEVERLKRERSK